MNVLKKWLPALVLAAGIAALASTLIPPRPTGPWHLDEFGRLPILANGRLKPLDTVARSTLLQLQARQDVMVDGQVISPEEWLLDVFFRPEKADAYRIFVIDNPDLLTLIGQTPETLAIRYPDRARQILAVIGFLPSSWRRFRYADLEPHLADIDRQADLADPVDASVRSPFQRAAIQLRDNLRVYQQLRSAVQVPGSDDFLGELLRFQDALPQGVAAVSAKQAGQPHDEDAAQAMLHLGERYEKLANGTQLLAVPPAADDTNANDWRNVGQAILESFQTGRVDASVLAYAGLGYSWRQNRPEEFNTILKLYRNENLAKSIGPRLRKTDAEVRFNLADPFYSTMLVYLVVFFLGVAAWLVWPDVLQRSAFALLALAWVATTLGILTRMWLEGRPPVTNLYSSALFIGWGAVALCLVLESIFADAIAAVAGGAIGFGTLIIAKHLALSGDTLEMMRAVLDSNFWLATHVVVVTTGYASTFLAGFLALIYIVRGVLTPTLDRKTADTLGRMVYGIVCFATLFSFVGTVLGGIWADQSWGRFWGWDPKENGALIIVLWNALILHARWCGLVRQRGLMGLAVFGNIVTSWSWFGTNMLGIGLHSYGFTAAAFWALAAFVATQLVFIALCCLPLSRWWSFRRENTERPDPTPQATI